MNDTILYRLKFQYNQVPYLIDGCSDVFLLKQHIPEKWSIHEHLAHLGRYQEVYMGRLESVLLGETPDLGKYIAEDDLSFSDWVIMDTQQIISHTQHLRSDIHQRLTSLSPMQLGLKGKHPTVGLLTIQELTEFFLLHESHHFFTMFKLVCQFRLKES